MTAILDKPNVAFLSKYSISWEINIVYYYVTKYLKVFWLAETRRSRKIMLYSPPHAIEENIRFDFANIRLKVMEVRTLIETSW
jgi:hypothetical protein